MAGVAVLLTFGCMVAGFCALVTVAYVAYQVVDHYVDGSSALQIPQIDDNVVPFPLPPQNNYNKKQEGPIQIVPPIILPTSPGTGGSPATNPSPNQKPETKNGMFYIAAVKKSKWRIQRGPYTANQLILVLTTLDAAGVYGENEAWGFYTPLESDARMMMNRISGGYIGPEGKRGQYPHYHSLGHQTNLVYNCYNHFHGWFGQIIT